ncbi:DNA cytosine methyltransferase [Lentzea sp. NPDC051838]|uniref:DNA cytosine methyltransferase n=1 Tax=Lentzea sp. NPDC051838 TaxID=3154849 RepID=UPI00343EFD6F
MPSLRELLSGSVDLTVGSLCTGYGGLDLGLLAAVGRGRIAWVADPDPHVRRILSARVPGVPNLGDVRSIDWATVEPVDAVTAGFPCQDISAAGRRAGIEKGERSGIWSDIVAGVRVLQPTLLVVENVAALRWRNGGLDRVLGDLAETGYDALWRSVRAAEVGCAHRRERVFLLAWLRACIGANAADSASARWRSPRRGRPGTSSSAGAPSQPSRRGGFGCEAVANAHRRGLEVCGNPDSAELQQANSTGLRDAHRLRATASDANRGKPERRRTDQQLVGASGAAPGAEGQRERDGHAVVDRGEVTAAANGLRRGRSESSHSRRRAIDGGGQRHLAKVADLSAEQAVGQHGSYSLVEWGEYTAAVRRWERLLGRAAPCPTQPGRGGRPVLAPVFVEHLMGLPEGWVSDLPLPRTAQLRALGNGVVPAQAAYALSLLLADLAALLADEYSADESEAA